MLRAVWKPEDEKYFGVNVWRTNTETNERIKMNKTLIIPGQKGTDSKGNPIYPDFFFSAANHDFNVPYSYEAEVVDFFNQEGQLSEPLDLVFEDRSPPPTPNQFELTKLNARQIYITWTDVEDANVLGYNVLAETKGNGIFTKVNETVIPLERTEYTYTIPEFGGYAFKIETIKNTGIRAQTEDWKQIDMLDTEPPKVPVNIQAVADTGVVKLSWDANTEGDLKGYIVFRSIRADNSVPFERVTPEPITTNQFQDKLQRKAKNYYYYKVNAVDTSFNASNFTAPVTIQLPDVTAPSAPVLIKATSTTDSVVLKWLPILVDDLASYEVFRKQEGEGTVWETMGAPLTNDITSYIDLNTEPGMDYQYKVRAADDTGNISEFSNIYNVRMKPDNTPVDGVERITTAYQKKKKQVTIKWKGEDPDRRGSMVFRKTGTGKLVPVSPMITEKAVFVDKKVKTGTTYAYLVKTYYHNGKIGKSSLEELTIAPEKEKKE